MRTNFQNLRIGQRIMLILILPITGLAVFAGYDAVRQARLVSQADSLQSLAELAPKISGLVHELQKERGNSAGFIGANGQGKFAQLVVAQRQASDLARSELLTALSDFDVSARGPEFAGRIDQA